MGYSETQPKPSMPTTPKLFSILHNAAGSLSVPAERPAGSRLGYLLSRLVDRLAPDGFEDEEGFHVQGAVAAGERRPSAEPNWWGEHI